ncbi:acyl-CoA dehydrogenase family protein [Gordonia soli]|uniref:Putative acyl-CoA dehydrogenase n=1 Tax=Gordonia soli NBRC 108243 TaxID=1223545 RepID=M0QIF1_9ACTN|nr:acyl-CoA dehydrogenase family protein [Gordonia soli]GAC68081.1 putative acyl-CoA dehydrogenase [Gordonia soli NBRC 108243]
MDFTLPETGTDVATLARDIATKVSTSDRVAELETTGAPIDADLWRELGAAGLLGLELASADLGDAGGDLTAIENLAVAEQLGRVLARVPFGPHAIAAAPVIARRADTDLRASLLGRSATGETVLTVAFEEDLGVEPTSPTTTLTARDGGHIVSGTKVDVPYASAADVFLVNVIGPDGARVVVIRSDDPGVTVTDTRTTGLTPTAQLELVDVAVGDDRLLSGGSDAITDVADRLTLAICADQSGAVQRALELTAEYAREREQFGKPIGSFQAVAQRLADGYIDAQGLKLTTTQATWLLSRTEVDGPDEVDGDLATAIQTAKFWATEAGHRVAHTAVHVHGGVGLDTSHPVHRYFLRAKQNEFALGSAPITLRRIGRVLAAQPV